MPELPEVETMVRGIRDRMTDTVIVDFVACPCDRRPLDISPEHATFRDSICGTTILEVQRRAKRIVISLSNGKAIVFEPRMTGLALIADPPSQEHLRFEFQLQRDDETHSVWLWDRRGLGTLRLYDKEQLAVALGPDRLGPDALCIEPDDLYERLKRTERPIKVALLDQKLIAGIGNLYASEILHRARIHPQPAASRLSRRRISRIYDAIQDVLQTAILYEGSTLNDGTYRNALNKDGSYQNQHCVYARSEELCPTCRSSNIRRIVQAQRSTFFCPKCQRT